LREDMNDDLPNLNWQMYHVDFLGNYRLKKWGGGRTEELLWSAALPLLRIKEKSKRKPETDMITCSKAKS